MGMTEPTPTALAQALFSTVQLRVLGLLFGQPDRSFQSAELIRLAHSGDGAVHRVLTRLAESGLVTVTRIGNQKHYQANAESPIFGELHGLIVKTVGLTAPLQAALAPFTERIADAFVYGSMARGTDTAKSDVDLMIVGDGLDYPKVYEALQGAERILDRKVNPTIYSRKEFRKRRREKNPFLERVLAQPKLWVIGSEHAFD
jgi:predicted nucleotidyltransferase